MTTPDRPTPKQEAMGYWDTARQLSSEALHARLNGDNSAALRDLIASNIALTLAVRVLIDQVTE